MPRAAIKVSQLPPTTASAAAPTAVDSHCPTHFNDSSRSAGDVLEQRRHSTEVHKPLQNDDRCIRGVEGWKERQAPGRGRARGSRGGRGWGDYLRGRGGGARNMSTRENRQVGSGGREGIGRGVGWGRREGESTPRPSGGHRQLNAKQMQTKFGFSSGVRAGEMAEAGRAGKQERETVRENWGEDHEELSGGESLDDRMEKLGRYLSANLNFEPDVEDYDDGGFVLDGHDDIPSLEGADDTLVPEGGLSYPASSATVPATSKVEELCLLSGGQCNKESVYSAQVGRSKEKPAVVLLSEEDEDVEQFEDLCEQFEDGPGQFNDRVGQFGSGVVPSTTFDYSLPPLVGGVPGRDGGKGEEGEGGGEDSEDDGWISDPEENENLFQLNSGMSPSFLSVCW